MKPSEIDTIPDGTRVLTHSGLFGLIIEREWVEGGTTHLVLPDRDGADAVVVSGHRGIPTSESGRRWLFRVEGKHGQGTQQARYLLVEARQISRVYDPCRIAQESVDIRERHRVAQHVTDTVNERDTAELQTVETAIAGLVPEATRTVKVEPSPTPGSNRLLAAQLADRKALLGYLRAAYENGLEQAGLSGFHQSD